MNHLEQQLEDYSLANKIKGKGPLSVALVVTRMAKKMDFPVIRKICLRQAEDKFKGLGERRFEQY